MKMYCNWIDDTLPSRRGPAIVLVMQLYTSLSVKDTGTLIYTQLLFLDLGLLSPRCNGRNEEDSRLTISTSADHSFCQFCLCQRYAFHFFAAICFMYCNRRDEEISNRVDITLHQDYAQSLLSLGSPSPAERGEYGVPVLLFEAEIRILFQSLDVLPSNAHHALHNAPNQDSV